VSRGKNKRGAVKEIGKGGVEEYFVEQVELHGGICPKLVDIGRKGFPDRTPMWPEYGWARIHFVELKTIGGCLESWQERYHKDLRAVGAQVFVIWTKTQVDEYVERFKPITDRPQCNR
jgi:hypothetical protein